MKTRVKNFGFYTLIVIAILLAALNVSCEPDEDILPEESIICTKYTHVPGREPQEWIIKNVTNPEEKFTQEGTDSEGRYFYIVCDENFEFPIP